MKICVEFKPQDCWVGVFWRRSVVRREHRPKEGRKGRLFVVSCPRLDVWICVLPCLPMHITRLGKETRESIDCASTTLERAIAGIDVEAIGWKRMRSDSPNAND